MPRKLFACRGFLFRVVHKNGRLRKFNRAREIEFNYFTAWSISINLAHLFIMLMATKVGLRFFNCCPGTYSTFTYNGSLKIEKLLKIFFFGQISRNKEAKAGECDIDSFSVAHLHGKIFARTWRHLGAIIIAPIGRDSVRVEWEMSVACHSRAWQKAYEHFDTLCDNL